MKLQKNSIHSNFVLKKIEKITDLSQTLYTFEHKKLGTKVYHLKNNDPEKLYLAGFKTVPEDDMGIPHILEHSVLSSTEKYPVRDLFVGLIKSAHVSFLNAMTFPDKTVYPVGTTNDTEFKKLISAYTDAAFKPLIHSNKKIFMQEGIRFELDSKGKLACNGTVFNEMKGALSGPDRLISEYSLTGLFPNNGYRYVSGGLPTAIPKLTHKKVADFHTKNYHPSNAHIFFYGDLDIREHLEFLETEYFSEYKKRKDFLDIKTQESFKKEKRISRKYKSGSSLEHYELSIVCGENKKPELAISASILMDYLMATSESPLKSALVKSGIAKEFDYFVEGELKQVYLAISCRGAKKGTYKTFEKIVYETIGSIISDGFDAKILLDTINKQELEWEEQKMKPQKGLFFYRLMASSLLYGWDPIVKLEQNKTLHALRAKVNKGYFEKLAKLMLLENNHKLHFTLEPTKKDLQEEEIQNFLKKKEKKLTESAREKLVSEKAELEAWQANSETEEFADYFPTLDLKEIPEKSPYEVLLDKSKKGSTESYLYADKKNKLQYLSLEFSASSIPQKDLHLVTLLGLLLKETGSSNYSATETVNTINASTSVFDIKPCAQTTKTGLDRRLKITVSFLKKDFKKLSTVLTSLCNEPVLSGEKIGELIEREISRLESDFTNAGHVYSKNRSLSSISTEAMFDDLTTGVGYYLALKKTQKEFKKKPQGVLATMQKIHSDIIMNKNRIGISAGKERFDTNIFTALKTKKTIDRKISTRKPESEIILTDGMSNFNAVGFKYSKKTTAQNISLRKLVAQHLRSTYLWFTLRDKGGAYGAMIALSREEVGAISTYRDPRIGGSLRDIVHIKKHIQDNPITENELHKTKVAVFSTLDAPHSLFALIEHKVTLLKKGITPAHQVQVRNNVLKARPKDFDQASEVFLCAIDRGVQTTFGTKETSSSEKKKFKSVIKIG